MEFLRLKLIHNIINPETLKENKKKNIRVERAVENIKPELKKAIQESIEKKEKIENTKTRESEKGNFQEIMISDFKDKELKIEIILKSPNMNIQYSFILEDYLDNNLSKESTITIKITGHKNQESFKKQADDFKNGLDACILNIIKEIKDQENL